MNQELKEKLNKEINCHLNSVKESGSSKFSTCDYRGWDKDIWNHRHQIIDKLRDKGLNISTQINWGVLDVTITANIEL
jgi:hypothetical protein